MSRRVRIKGRFGIGGLSSNQVKASRVKSKVKVLDESDVVGGTIQNTSNSFNLNVNLEIINNFIQALEEPKILTHYTQSLISEVISGKYGVEFSSFVKSFISTHNGYQLFVSFINSTSSIPGGFSNETEKPIPDAHDLLLSSSVFTLDSTELTLHSGDIIIPKNEGLELARREYEESLISATSKYLYHLRIKDSLKNTWGFSVKFRALEVLYKPFVIDSSINDTLTANKDGFSINETFFIWLVDESTSEEYLCDYTADQTTVLDKGIVNLQSLTLKILKTI